MSNKIHKGLPNNTDTDQSDKLQCRRCDTGPVVSVRRSSSQCGQTSSEVGDKESSTQCKKSGETTTNMLQGCIRPTLKRKRVT